MDKNKLIIIALVIIILILAAALFATNYHAKEDTKLRITSNSTLNEGDSIKVMLTDLNGTPISNQSINVTITDKDNASSYFGVVTDDTGIGTLKLKQSEGNYTVTCTFGGNEKYVGNSTIKNITIKKEEVVESQSSSSSSSSSGSSQSESSQSQYGSYINGKWESMTEKEYAERYPASYHISSLEEGRYDKYHPELYEVDRENGYI